MCYPNINACMPEGVSFLFMLVSFVKFQHSPRNRDQHGFRFHFQTICQSWVVNVWNPYREINMVLYIKLYGLWYVIRIDSNDELQLNPQSVLLIFSFILCQVQRRCNKDVSITITPSLPFHLWILIQVNQSTIPVFVQHRAYLLVN